MGCRLLSNSPSGDRKLSIPIFAGFGLRRLHLGAGQDDPGPGKVGMLQPERSDQSGQRILVIEDDPFSLELYTILLEAAGCTTLPAADGEAGLAAARRELPDLIICDVILPKLSGYDVVRALKANPVLRRVPVIAVTVLDSRDYGGRLQAAGFDGYIAKPIEAKDFVEQIKKFYNPKARSSN